MTFPTPYLRPILWVFSLNLAISLRKGRSASPGKTPSPLTRTGRLVNRCVFTRRWRSSFYFSLQTLIFWIDVAFHPNKRIIDLTESQPVPFILGNAAPSLRRNPDERDLQLTAASSEPNAKASVGMGRRPPFFSHWAPLTTVSSKMKGKGKGRPAIDAKRIIKRAQTKKRVSKLRQKKKKGNVNEKVSKLEAMFTKLPLHCLSKFLRYLYRPP